MSSDHHLLGLNSISALRHDHGDFKEDKGLHGYISTLATRLRLSPHVHGGLHEHYMHVITNQMAGLPLCSRPRPCSTILEQARYGSPTNRRVITTSFSDRQTFRADACPRLEHDLSPDTPGMGRRSLCSIYLSPAALNVSLPNT